jgi:hypothetical protein
MPARPNNQPQTIRETAYFSIFEGGNAKDDIAIIGNENLINGGNGDDILAAFGMLNTLNGGNGKDDLLAVSEQYWPASYNTLNGGNGVDTLRTVGAFGSDVAGVGAFLTGGRGMDQFQLRQNSDVLLSNIDSYGNATIMEGDTIQGVFDVITDYTAGELIDLGATTLRTDPLGLTHMWPGHSHITLDDGEYAFVRGNWDGDGHFNVQDDGADLMVIYDLDPPNEYYFEYSGSVILVGVTDESSVNIGTLAA